MRIVLDLQITQSAAHRPDAGQAALDEALALARLIADQNTDRHAPPHELWIALIHHDGDRDSASIEAVRRVFDGIIGRERIVVFNVPATMSQAAQWQQRANEHIRENFLAGLKPDLVYVPHFADSIMNTTVHSVSALSETFITALGLSELTLLLMQAEPKASEQQNRFHLSLQYAVLILTRSPQAREALAAIHADTTAQVIQLTDSKDAAQANAVRLLAAFKAAFAARHRLTDAAAATPKSQSPIQRPRLAYISPLPPLKSGIADYSAELIPELARYYEIVVIIDQGSQTAPWVNANLPLRGVDWFDAHAHQFDRVLYHIGNSPLHQHMFDLFERHPGIVVLHDFFLGNVLNHLDGMGYMPGVFSRALYQSHGWPAFFDRKKIGAESNWKYPCNKTLIDQASGVIVHSALPAQLARQWYGPEYAADWRVLPLLRGKPAPTATPTTSAAPQNQPGTPRQQARSQLKLAESDFVFCAFGMLGPTKLNARLIAAWLASPLAHDPMCRLIFVGENDPEAYGEELAQTIAASACREQINITGFVSHQDYCRYLEATDCAVQLRTQSRGETSAAVLDCLLHGVPSIVNAHGANAELAHDVLHMLAEDCPLDALVAALTKLHADAAYRSALAQRADQYMQAHHAPRPVGLQYRDAIEHFTTQGLQHQYRQLIGAIADIGGSRDNQPPSERALHDTAAAIAANQPPTLPRQLFIDISAMAQQDLKTGIQRVVRSILTALLNNPPAGYRIEPVYCRGDGSAYHYARQYMLRQLDIDPKDAPSLIDAPLETRPGDLFIGVDLYMDGTKNSQVQLQTMRNRGVEIYFVVYDILPLLLPKMFPTGSVAHFEAWLNTVATVADGLVCISRAVADEVTAWLAKHPAPRQADLALGYFHLGADIDASAPSAGMPPNAEQTLQLIRARPSILMVGTVEPRKGHAQTLAAFEILWAQGGPASQVNLVIVGKHGWMVDAVTNRLRNHPENGKRLFWLEGCSDEMLLAVYQTCVALLAASEGEGFGLPLIEAAQHQLAIIARDIPVFREVAGDHAFYFEGLDAPALANALQAWLHLHASGDAQASNNMPWLTWEQSAQQLQDAILRHQWHRLIPVSI
jgi:glycosyltransferase involved in cell wall biosynthesis